jgi:hypothetical protein
VSRGDGAVSSMIMRRRVWHGGEAVQAIELLSD